MSDTHAIFDTNALPVRSNLDNVLWLSIFRLCKAAGILPSVPSIVIDESVNLRRKDYLDASSKFRSSFNFLSRFFDVQAVYIPAVEEVIALWEKDLRESFDVIDTHGEDAAEALKREALRSPPARLGTGGRDALVWLTAMRLASRGDKVFLVSRNTKDFADGESGHGLHPALAEEVAGVDGELRYFTSIDEFIEHFASRSAPPTVESVSLVSAVQGEVMDAIVAAIDAQDDSNQRLPVEQISQAVLDLRDVRSLRSYSIGTEGLALIDGKGGLRLTFISEQPAMTFSFDFRAWLTYDLDSLMPESGEVQSLTLIEGP